MLTSLRHLGRSWFLAEEKRSAVWRVTYPDATLLSDLSGSALSQNLSQIPVPSINPFALVTPSSGVETPLRAELEEKVLELSSLGEGGCLWASSGSDATEIAVWAADLYALHSEGSAVKTFLVRRGGYHGNTYLTRFLSTRGAMAHRENMDGRTLVILEEEPASDDPNPLLKALKQAEAGGQIVRPAVLIVEPLPTTGRNFWLGERAYCEVAAWCHERGIITIFDEIASGVYRHGRFNAFSWAAATGRPNMSLIAKGLTCGTFPLSCVVFNEGLTRFLRARGARPLTFTHALSDPAAWFALACLRRYAEVLASPGYQKRRALVCEIAAWAADRLPEGAVEHSETTIRVTMSPAVVDSALSLMAADGLWAYCGYTDLPLPDAEYFDRRGFIHFCPPLDLPLEELEPKLRRALELVTRAKE